MHNYEIYCARLFILDTFYDQKSYNHDNTAKNKRRPSDFLKIKKKITTQKKGTYIDSKDKQKIF